MRSTGRVDELEVEVAYYRDRVALMRARLYRGGTGTNARLEELMRSLEGAEGRLQRARDATSAAPAPDAGASRPHVSDEVPAASAGAGSSPLQPHSAP